MTASAAISDLLLEWYDRSARTFPWRLPPGSGSHPDPYQVWLSEVMLQQTTTTAVVPYFRKFVAAWPTVEALASAPEEEVLAAWAGLGYYSRARNLVKAARAVQARGGFPDTEAGLRALPGVGEYIAAAVAAIAFGRPAVVVDANVERVVARLFALDEPLPKVRSAIRERTADITPRERAGDFAQAMMDLGATICTPRDPKCLLCPLNRECQGLLTGDPAALPVKVARKARRHVNGTAFWIEREGAVWLVRRPDQGMLGGMRALPDDGWSASADGSDQPPLKGAWKAGGMVEHGFTHCSLALSVAIYAGDDWESLGEDGEWWSVAEIGEAGLPTLYAKVAERVLAVR